MSTPFMGKIELDIRDFQGRLARIPGCDGAEGCAEATAPRTLGASFKALAEVEFTDKSQGVIFAQGSRFGGYSLVVKNGKLVFAYNFLGIPPEQRLSCDVPKTGRHIVGVEFAKAAHGEHGEAQGKMTLYLDDRAVAQDDFRTQSGHYALCGEGLCIGYDSGDAVSSEYKSPATFSRGKVIKAIFDVAKDHYIDVERRMAAALARD